MKELTLQIKPVGNHCNLNCSYCYAAPFKSKQFNILNESTLEKIIKEAFDLTDNLIVSWHGGEPMMAGLHFFRKYIEIINKFKKDSKTVYNMIQNSSYTKSIKNNKYFFIIL